MPRGTVDSPTTTAFRSGDIWDIAHSPGAGIELKLEVGGGRKRKGPTLMYSIHAASTAAAINETVRTTAPKFNHLSDDLALGSDGAENDLRLSIRSGDLHETQKVLPRGLLSPQMAQAMTCRMSFECDNHLYQKKGVACTEFNAPRTAPMARVHVTEHYGITIASTTAPAGDCESN